MELSKEEIKILQSVRDKSIPTGVDDYYNNEILQGLMHTKGLVIGTMGIDEKTEALYPESYELTTKGQNELSIALQKRNENRRKAFLYPTINSLISGIIGIIIGILATYLKMK